MPTDKSYACLHVVAGVRPVLYACREDGDLMFSCGADDHDQSIADWKVVHRAHLTNADSTIIAVVDVANGEQAVRSAIAEPWVRGPIED